MYSSYTTLQRVQLAKQEYLDTQEVFLGVYAPGRNASLKASAPKPSAAPSVCFWSGKTFS